MEITKEQIKRLSKAVTEIEKDVLIDDDVSGGYLPEPYKSSIAEIYNVINECEGNAFANTESKLNLADVSGSLPPEYSDLLNAAKKAYVSIRHEKNPSNTQLEAYFDIEKAVKAIEGNDR